MELGYILGIYACALLAIIWAIINTCSILSIKIETKETDNHGYNQAESNSLESTMNSKLIMVKSIGEKIEKGAYAFLTQEYLVMFFFVIIFSIIVCLVVDVYGNNVEGVKFRMYATTAFIIGCLTSILCGWIGMAIAVKTNFRTTFMAM